MVLASPPPVMRHASAEGWNGGRHTIRPPFHPPRCDQNYEAASIGVVTLMKELVASPLAGHCCIERDLARRRGPHSQAIDGQGCRGEASPSHPTHPAAQVSVRRIQVSARGHFDRSALVPALRTDCPTGIWRNSSPSGVSTSTM